MKKLLSIALIIGQTLISFSQDTVKYVFAETFEHIPDLSQKTILNTWQIKQGVYTPSSQSLTDLGNEHGKVWTAVYHEGKAAGYGDDGFAFDIPVGGEFDELWFESDLYADPDFDPYSVTGNYSGKMLFGFTGGNEYLHGGVYQVDSSAEGNGWTAQGVWGSQYALRPYYYDQIADGQTHQLNANLLIPRGYWIHITRRVKMNTPGKKDGIYEVYINDSLRAQATDVEWRSLQQGANYGKISHLHMTYFFGGCGPDYASKRDNFIRIDNLVAYYYTPQAKGYLYGPAPMGHKVARNIPKNDLYPAKILFDEVFDKPSGTIKSHYNCGVFAPTSADVIKKEITRPEGPVKLTFIKYKPGVNNCDELNSYTKVYSGRGDNKSLLYTFNRDNMPGGTYTIDNNEVTIEYFSGNSESKGFEIYYTSPGSDNESVTPDKPTVTNNAPVINNQQFIINERDFSANYVGKLIAFDGDAGQQLTYSIISGNQSGLFNLDSKTGTLTTTKSDLFAFDLTEFNLVIQVKDNGTDVKSASATINVQFIASSREIYIDPKNTSDAAQDGSINHPFDSWNDVSWAEGYTYLQKSGTTASVSNIVIGASNVTLDSYGEGNIPVITSTTNNYLISGFEKSNINIQNLHLSADQAVSTIYFAGSTSSNIHVEHCTIEGYENSIKTVDCRSVFLKYNTISSLQEGVYTTATENEIYYNIFKNNRISVNIVGAGSTANVFNNVFANNANAVTASYAGLNIFNNIFYLPDASQTAIDYNADKLTSDNNIYYPEQNGFVKISGKIFNSLANLQDQSELDLNSFNSDPLFVDPDNEDFAVDNYSPAINAGKNLNIDKDFYGEDVPYEGIADIGIAENNGKSGRDAILPELVLYPNPSSGYVNIDADFTNSSFEAAINPADNSGFRSELKILDMNGKIIFAKIIEHSEALFHLNIDLTGISKGIYSVILKIAEKTIANKLIIE
jgi:hypothetical protein